MKFFAVAAAMTKATGNDLGKAFVADPSEDTMNAILEAAEKNLRRLIRGEGKAPAKKPAAAKTARRETVKAKAEPKSASKRNPLAREFKVGTKVRVVKRDGDKFVGVIEKHKVNGATIRLKGGDLEYGRFTQMTAL